MNARLPITRAILLDALDDRELFEGYRAGKDGWPEPGDNRSFSYWHGWRNGAVDGHHIEKDDAMADLARDAIETGYLKRMSMK